MTIDVEEFAASARPVKYDDLDLANAFKDRPLKPETLVQYLLGGDGGGPVVKRLDQRLERLPGMQGLRLVEGEVQRWYAVAA